MPFCGMCAASVIECPCLEHLIARIAKTARCMRPPWPVVWVPGWRIHAVLWHVCDLGYRMPACLELLIAHIAKNAMYAPPLISGSSPGGAYMPFCGMCATSGFRRAACLEPLIAHIAKNAMYAPPLISGSSPGGAYMPFCGM